MVAPPTSTHEDVAVHGLRQDLDPAQDGVGGGGAHDLREQRVGGEVLPADDVLEEHGADRPTGRVRRDDADPGHDVVGRLHRLVGASEDGDHVVARVGVAGDDHRDAQGRRGERAGVVAQHLRVAAVGAAHEQHQVGGRVGQGRHGGAVHGPAPTCTTRAPALRPTRRPASAVTTRS